MKYSPECSLVQSLTNLMPPLQAQWVHAVTNAPLTISSALIDNDTGETMGLIGLFYICCCTK